MNDNSLTETLKSYLWEYDQEWHIAKVIYTLFPKWNVATKHQNTQYFFRNNNIGYKCYAQLCAMNGWYKNSYIYIYIDSHILTVFPRVHNNIITSILLPSLCLGTFCRWNLVNFGHRQRSFCFVRSTIPKVPTAHAQMCA